MLLFVSIYVNNSYAMSVEIKSEGQYTMGDGESIKVAKERAKYNALQNAAEKAGVYIESYAVVKNGILEKEEINVIAAKILHIKEIDIQPAIDGNAIMFVCKIQAIIDTDNIDIENIHNQKKRIEKEVELQKQINILQKEIEVLKEKYDAGNSIQKESIKKEILFNEEKFSEIQTNMKEVDGNYINQYVPIENKEKTVQRLENDISKQIFNCNVIVTDYKLKSYWSTSLVRNRLNNELWIIIGDHRNIKSKYAGIPYHKDIFEFDKISPEDHRMRSLIIFNMVFFNEEPNGIDDKLGVWNNGNHYIPLYVSYTVYNNIVMVNFLNSANNTLHPSHYHPRIQDLKNHGKMIESFFYTLPQFREKVYSEIKKGTIPEPEYS